MSRRFKLAILAVAVFLVVAATIGVVRPWLAQVMGPVETALMFDQRQQQVARTSRANQVITTTINRTLAAIPSAARIRVGLIAKESGLAPLRYDTTHTALRPGNRPLDIEVGMPLNGWQAYMGSFLANRCALVRATDAALMEASRARLQGLGVAGVLGCPLTSAKGDLLGAVFVSWDDPAAIPADAAPVAALLADAAREIAGQVPDLY